MGEGVVCPESLQHLRGKKGRERQRQQGSERLIAMTETWVICGFLFPDCPQDYGDISDTVTGAHCPCSSQCSLGNFESHIVLGRGSGGARLRLLHLTHLDMGKKAHLTVLGKMVGTRPVLPVGPDYSTDIRGLAVSSFLGNRMISSGPLPIRPQNLVALSRV